MWLGSSTCVTRPPPHPLPFYFSDSAKEREAAGHRTVSVLSSRTHVHSKDTFKVEQERGRFELEQQPSTLSRVLRNVGFRRDPQLLEMQQLSKVKDHTGARKTEHLGERKQQCRLRQTPPFGDPQLVEVRIREMLRLQSVQFPGGAEPQLRLQA